MSSISLSLYPCNHSLLITHADVNKLRSHQVKFPGSAKFYGEFTDLIDQFCHHLDRVLAAGNDAVDALSQLGNFTINNWNMIDPVRKDAFYANCAQALERLSLNLSSNLSSNEERRLITCASIADGFRADGKLTWKPEHKASNNSGDMSLTAINELKRVVGKRIVTIGSREHTLQVINAGSIGVIMGLANKNGALVKAYRLISPLGGITADQFITYANNFKEAADTVTDGSLVPCGESKKLSYGTSGKFVVIQPMRAVNTWNSTSTKTLEEYLLEELPVRDDYTPLEYRTGSLVVKLFTDWARAIKSSHDAGFAQCNLKLDGVRLSGKKTDLIRVNTSLCKPANEAPSQGPLYGSYALRDWSNNSFSATPTDKAVCISDLHAWGVHFAQALLGKENGRLAMLYAGGPKLDPEANTEWIKELLSSKASEGEAHDPNDTTDGGQRQFQHACTSYAFTGEYEGKPHGLNLHTMLYNKLLDTLEEESANALALLITDLCVYKKEANGDRNLKLTVSDDNGAKSYISPTIDNVIDVLKKLMSNVVD